MANPVTNNILNLQPDSIQSESFHGIQYHTHFNLRLHSFNRYLINPFLIHMKISHIFPPLCPYGHTKPYFHNSIKYTLSIYHMMKQVHLNSYTSKPSFSIILNSLFTSSNSILIPPYNTTVSLGWSSISLK